MNNYGGGIASADGIAASFPHKILKKINGTPSRIDIDNAQEKQTENAASRPSTRGGGENGHAGMVVPPERYIVEFSPTSYAWEPIPYEALVYPVGITALFPGNADIQGLIRYPHCPQEPVTSEIQP